MTRLVTSLAPLACLLGASLAGCALSGDGVDGDTGTEEQGVSTTYVDLSEFEKIDQDEWFDNLRKLTTEFNAICGDTFCEGSWSNLTPLTFGCAVTSKAGNVKDCVWTFAASSVDVDVTTAGIFTNAPTFQCPVTIKTTAVKLSHLLATSSNALQAALPGTPSIYEQLGDCFEHPIGATPGRPAGTSPATYISATSYYTQAASQQKWRAAKSALVAGFDRICGDTFCSSDYGDLQSLDLECSITKSTGNVKKCAWVFGGSYKLVAEHGGGKIAETSQSFRCDFTVAGTLSQLITTLTAPGTSDAINRPLPGGTATAYDALAGCLP